MSFGLLRTKIEKKIKKDSPKLWFGSVISLRVFGLLHMSCNAHNKYPSARAVLKFILLSPLPRYFLDAMSLTSESSQVVPIDRSGKTLEGFLTLKVSREL